VSQTTLFLQPLDVLLLRGNKLFGEAGSYGEALIPPWPSVAAGALRSRMLADARLDWTPARNQQSVDPHPELGTPDQPGSFTVTAFHLARRDASGRVERLYQLPADLSASPAAGGAGFEIRKIEARALPAGLESSYSLPLHTVLAESTRSKPETGLWLTEAGWTEYLAGRRPSAAHLVHASELWRTDLRVGVGLDPDRRAAEDGKLFSIQAIAPASRSSGYAYDVGFSVEVRDATPPTAGLVRFGGDGRACAVFEMASQAPRVDSEDLARAGRLRMIATTPGIYSHGWLPTGANPACRRKDGAIRFELDEVAGWIVCAAVARADVVSGFDLAAWRPKPAERVAPTGSVWWLELEPHVTASDLDKLAERGLWPESEYNINTRRAEGFNRVALAMWNA
jgi:CRISPR-associated protein Cmr3